MQEKMLIFSGNNNPEDLNEPPHILSQLTDIVIRKRQFSPCELERRWNHLAECIYCQVFLGTYLLGIIANEKEQGISVEPARALLSQLTRIMHKTLEEAIPTYIEVLVEQGDEAAKQRFPLLTDHLQTCQDCQLAVQNLRAWLQHLEQMRIAER